MSSMGRNHPRGPVGVLEPRFPLCSLSTFHCPHRHRQSHDQPEDRRVCPRHEHFAGAAAVATMGGRLRALPPGQPAQPGGAPPPSRPCPLGSLPNQVEPRPCPLGSLPRWSSAPPPEFPLQSPSPSLYVSELLSLFLTEVALATPHSSCLSMGGRQKVTPSSCLSPGHLRLLSFKSLRLQGHKSSPWLLWFCRRSARVRLGAVQTLDWPFSVSRSIGC